MDYDDLLLYWYFMVKEKGIAESIGRRFDHILVDEYQDTNKLQSEILINIKPDGKGLTVVGTMRRQFIPFGPQRSRICLILKISSVPKPR